MKSSGWQNGLTVTGGGTGVVSHAGLALIRALADNTGLTAGLSQALATDRLLAHDRGRVVADLACVIADGGEAVSDFRVVGDQHAVFGPVASVPTAWRTLSEVAAGGSKAAGRITTAVGAARRSAWAGIAARHGGLPGIRIAGKTLEGVTCIRLDATVTACHSDKELAEPNFKGFGYHPVRREALSIRAEVRDRRRRPCRSREAKLGGSLIQEVLGRAGAVLTTPGRAGTARRCGSGKRDGEEYARNRRLKIPQNRTGPEPGGYGPERRVPAGHGGGGELRADSWMVPPEATVKCCGVAVAMPQGQSRAPPSSSESR